MIDSVTRDKYSNVFADCDADNQWLGTRGAPTQQSVPNVSYAHASNDDALASNDIVRCAIAPRSDSITGCMLCCELKGYRGLVLKLNRSHGTFANDSGIFDHQTPNNTTCYFLNERRKTMRPALNLGACLSQYLFEPGVARGTARMKTANAIRVLPTYAPILGRNLVSNSSRGKSDVRPMN